METPDYISRHRIVGGNLALDLLNTQNGAAGLEPEDDSFYDYADVVAWGGYVGMLTDGEVDRLLGASRADPEGARNVFQRTVEPRASLSALSGATANGAAPASHDIDRLQRDEAEALAH